MNISIEDQLIIDNFKSLQKHLTYTILIPLLIIGNIGCIFNTIIFRRPYFKSSSCSRYFLASSSANAFQLIIGLTASILDFGFSIHPHHHSLILCKFRNYSINIAGFLSQTYLLIACIDRYLITTCYRRMSQMVIANRIIFFNACFWFINLSHMLIYSEISSPKSFCFYSSSSYILFLSLHIFNYLRIYSTDFNDYIRILNIEKYPTYSTASMCAKTSKSLFKFDATD